MRLSDVRENGVIVHRGRRGIVVQRDPADRSSGVTTVQWEAGGQEDFVWDYDDPDVKYVGKGKLKTIIELEGSTQ